MTFLKTVSRKQLAVDLLLNHLENLISVNIFPRFRVVKYE
jgi:hypothetical protein